MAEVTQEMILDYMIKKGGVVKNVDLVRHFRKYLQIESAAEKDRARVVFKERVNTVAFIKADNKQEKTLHLRSEFCPPGLTRPPTGRTVTGSEQSSVSSLEDAGPRPQHQLENRFSLASIGSEPSTIHSPDPIVNSHTTPTASPPPVTLSPLSVTPPPYQPATPTESTATPTMNSAKLKGLGEDDFGASLMAELSSFGSILDTFGTSGGSLFSSSSKAPPTSNTSSSSNIVASSSSADHAPSTGPTHTPTSSPYSNYSTGHTSSTHRTPPPASSPYSNYSTSSPLSTGHTSSTSHTSSTRSTPPPSSSAYSNYSSPQKPTNSYSTTSKPPSSKLVSPQRPVADPSPQKPPTHPSPQRSGFGSGSPYHSAQTTPQRAAGVTNGMPKSKAGSRGQSNDMDFDLTDVLSSLPSANPSSFGKKAKPADKTPKFGAATEKSRFDEPGKPAQQKDYQNSTKFEQPKVTQPSFQNSTRFDQPNMQPAQNNFQNSTRFDQPKFQNSTKFEQPNVQSQHSYQSSTKFEQPKAHGYQNSTKFEQPKLPQPQAPPTHQNQSYLNGSRYDPADYYSGQGSTRNSNMYKLSPGPPAPRSRSTGIGIGSDLVQSHSNTTGIGIGSGSMQSTMQSTPGIGIGLGSVQSHSNTSGTRYSSYAQPTQQYPGPGPSAPPSAPRQAPPPAPTRTSSISQDSLPRSNTRRSAPGPPSGQQSQATPITTPPLTMDSSQGSTSSSPYPSSLGTLDLGDLSSSFLSSAAGAPVVGPTPSIKPVGGDSVDASQAAPTYKLGPAVSLPPPSGGYGPRSQVERRQNSGDLSSRRQGSVDSTPSIRIDSPTGASDSGSPRHSIRGRSPPHSYGDSRMRASSSGNISSNSVSATGVSASALANLGVQLRNKEGKRSVSGARRSSKNMEKNANLDNYTRLSISMTPPAARKHRPPDVAPKPLRNSSSASSREDLRAQQGMIEGPDDDVHSEYDYDEIDPLEKEWMLAGAMADLDGLQRLMMTDPNLLNHRGFLHGYTALHWAAKHGRMDILSMLLMEGAHTDVKTTGLTPLHLAAQAGHDNIIEVLVSQHNANINLRENGGRRAIDLLNSKCSQTSKTLLSHLHNHGLPIRVENQPVPTFSRPHEVKSSLDRNWRSMGELIHNATDRDRHGSKKSRMSPRTNIKKTFSFSKKGFKINRESVAGSPKKHHKKSRPVSEAVYNRYDA